MGGMNYGQESSRKHAALVLLYLGIKAVLVKSFARIHKANLVNNGIIPLVFENQEDYDNIEKIDEFLIENTVEQIKKSKIIDLVNVDKKKTYKMCLDLSPRQVEIIIAGGV